MRVADLNWIQLAALVAHEDRAVLPIGSTEQHAYLSLATDSTLAEKVAIDAAEPLGVPVFPALAYGVTPIFRAYPGTVTLTEATFLGVVREILAGFAENGFRRVLVVNGHGGNTVLHGLPAALAGAAPRIRVHDWWKAPRTMAAAKAIDADATHASWMENFPWTRLAGVVSPGGRKPVVDFRAVGALDPRAAREALGDGSGGGPYQRDDAEMRGLWEVAVGETRAMLTDGWDGGP